MLLDWAYPPDEAVVSAGVSTNLILAPVTGPLNKAESFIEAGGIIFGLLTGGHGLVLACLKLLVHNAAKRLAVRGAVKAFGGSQTDRPRLARRRASPRNQRVLSDAQHTAPQSAPVPSPLRHQETPSVLRPPQVPVLQAAPVTRRQPTPSEVLWHGLAFPPKPSAGSGAASPAPAASTPKRCTTKPVAPLTGDDAFLETLHGASPDSGATQADAPKVRRSRGLSRGEHGIIKMGGVGFGISSSNLGSQAVYQHPDCLAGDCAPLGLPCLCPCGVCHPILSSE